MNVKCFTLRGNIAVWLNGIFVTLFFGVTNTRARFSFLFEEAGRSIIPSAPLFLLWALHALQKDLDFVLDALGILNLLRTDGHL